MPPTTPPAPTPVAPPKKGQLLSNEFMARLDQLDVMSRKLLAGKMKGERRSKRRGQSVEFADYRNYVIGDDLRFIDWNIYARLEKLFLKLFLEEEDLSLYLLVDVSKSCDFGEPNKAFYIKQVAAALGYVGLVNYNRVNIVAFADGVVTESGGLRGRTKVNQMIGFIDKLKPDGPSNFVAACKRFALAHRNKGVCVVLSDFFVKEGFEHGLRYIAGGKYDLFAVQVLSPEEIDPALQGDLKLRDMEDDDLAEVSITQPLIKKYKENLNAYCLSLKEYLTRRGGTYLFTSTAVPFDTLVLNYLRERGLLG
ncbi:MAG TPA: DUF58 domain-containing protein [Tepidisphaeraceae bacterium]|nr:DUF58 domain-containing protein [Tepidisphaeraceae bacterium]